MSQASERFRQNLPVLRRAGKSHAAADFEVEPHRAGRGTGADIIGGNRGLHCNQEALPKFPNHAAAVLTMNTQPKIIYLFLSSEKDFAAFPCILTKRQKSIDTIDSVGVPAFSMVSRNVP